MYNYYSFPSAPSSMAPPSVDTPSTHNMGSNGPASPLVLPVEPGLFLGNWAASFDQQCHRASGITAVLTIHFGSLANHFLSTWQSTPRGQTHHQFANLGENVYPNLLSLLPAICDFIDAHRGITDSSTALSVLSPGQNGAVLICSTGPAFWAFAVIMAYVMRARTCDTFTALRQVAAMVPDIDIPAYVFHQLGIWRSVKYALYGPGPWFKRKYLRFLATVANGQLPQVIHPPPSPRPVQSVSPPQTEMSQDLAAQDPVDLDPTDLGTTAQHSADQDLTVSDLTVQDPAVPDPAAQDPADLNLADLDLADLNLSDLDLADLDLSDLDLADLNLPDPDPMLLDPMPLDSTGLHWMGVDWSELGSTAAG
ncbi:hypothetical protein ACRALDRAFT_1069263 [Sodiomyces alcalophilus JCM 7366]|uniref:uncharacterized protein n=1 Tax=Sodiomyces alcalophilus JCM 7366 TaxID=591952 RepID=UPI0039B6265D